MGRSNNIFIILIILGLLASCSIAGCIAPANTSPTAGTSGSTTGAKTGAKTSTAKTNSTPQPGPIPNTTWGNATLYLTSTPGGADVYVNDNYVGIAPVTINNLTGGIKYNVSLKLEGYGRYTGTVAAKNGTTVTLNGKLPEAKPKITVAVTNSTSDRVADVCIFTYTGNLTNSGDATARFVNVTLEFTPKQKGYDKKVTWTYIDTLLPGTAAGFNFYMAVPCAGNYAGKISYNGIQVTGSDTLRIDKKVSGSISV
jgi:hypothetical protein